MVVRPCGNTLEVHAPAKLNLHLEILARRPDGFHELETLMLSFSLFDTLRFAARRDNLLLLDCRWTPGLVARLGISVGDLPATQDNLVYRALDLLRNAAGAALGADVQLIKRIPLQA